MKKFYAMILGTVCIFCALLFSGCFFSTVGRTNYYIECTLSEEMVLTGKEVVTYYNDTDNTFSEIKFNLFGNAFRKDAKYSPIATQYTSKAYPNGKSYGDIVINDTMVGNKQVEFSICGEDENILSLKLEEELFPNESCTMTIDFTLNLANVIARTGYNDKTINLANFYPIVCGIEDGAFYECLYYSNGDPFYSDCSDYTVCLTVPSEYVVASSGALTQSKTMENQRKDTYSLKNARSFACVLSKEFDLISTESCGVNLNYYFYDDKTPEKSLEQTKKSIEAFTEMFGAYPYSTYSVVETKFVQGGMEFPGLVMISDELEEASYLEVIVHETAHQWWQTGVGNNEVKHAFLDEGLAEYAVILFYEKYPEFGFTRQSLIDSTLLTYKTYCSVYDKLFGNVDTTMDRALNEFTSEYEYVNIAYIKSCIMFDYLRETIGDEKFFLGLQRYYKEYCFKNAKPEDLVGVYEKIGACTNSFFDSFINGKVIL